jgi:3-oxoacyl-(acyl-carrier-protein) synthase
MLETEASAAARNAPPRGRLHGAGLAPDADTAIRAALEQAYLTPHAIRAVYANHAASTTLFDPAKITNPETLCGDVQGATTALHVCLALLTQHAGPCLILTSDNNTHIAIVVQT